MELYDLKAEKEAKENEGVAFHYRKQHVDGNLENEGRKSDEEDSKGDNGKAAKNDKAKGGGDGLSEAERIALAMGIRRCRDEKEVLGDEAERKEKGTTDDGTTTEKCIFPMRTLGIIRRDKS